MMQKASIILPLIILLFGCVNQSVPAQSPTATRQLADEFFQELHQEEQRVKQPEEPATSHLSDQSVPAPPEQPVVQYPESDYLLATGRGDLSKGSVICERVSDTVARMELAKQIRVLVKEQAVDRVRERSGQPLEQNIEIVREELTNELLLDVKIVGRTMDTAAGTCSSTAVMPKNRITSKSLTNPVANPTTP